MGDFRSESRKRWKEAKATFLYVIVPDGQRPDRLKVGVSYDVKKRIAAIGGVAGVDVKCILCFAFPNRYEAFRAEDEICCALQKQWIKGEWFKFSFETMAYLDELSVSGRFSVEPYNIDSKYQCRPLFQGVAEAVA